MFAAFDIFQTAFLALCLSRLSDLVSNIFLMSSRGNNSPPKEQITKIVSRIQEEIEAVKLDGRLTLLVLGEIGKVLMLLSQRAEYQIHDQNFKLEGVGAAVDNNNPSNYMDEVQKCILHFRSEFLSRLLPSSLTHTARASAESICIGLARRMASRVLTFFIRHAALVRPLSESGKLRMARDMAELELAVGQNLFPVEQLGAPYRALRAFRPLIFLETSQLEGSPLLQV